MEEKIEYLEEGFVRETTNAMVSLFIGIGVIILVVILVGLLGAKAHSATQTDLAAITEIQIRRDVNDSIVNSFGALGDAAGFLGIIILAIVFALVLLLLQGTLGAASGGVRGV